MSTAMKNLSARRSHASVGRPNLHGAQAHPRRVGRGLPRQAVASCVVERPKVRPAVASVQRLGMRMKALAVGVIAVAGGVVGITGYVSAVVDAHAAPGVADAAAWAHVEP